MPPRRTAPDSVLFSTYNTLDLFEARGPAGRERYGLVAEVIRGLDADVLAVQEIRAGSPQTARARLRRLAADVGMECVVSDSAYGASGKTALAVGSRGYHCGLMWRAGIEVLPGSFRQSGAGRLWHAAGWATVVLGGRRIRHGVFHATPFHRQLRALENELLVSLLSSGPDAELPLLIGADWNAESADRVLDEATGALTLYEPGDPFGSVAWFDDLAHQCELAVDADGVRRHWVDRTAGEVLLSGGLIDAAAALRAPWQPTTGHYPGDGYGSQGITRRIDGIRVTEQVTPALRAHWVTDSRLARSASDHLPVTVEYVPAAIAAD